MTADFRNDFAPVVSLKATNQSDPSVPVNGTGVDLAGYDGCMIMFDAGTLAGSSTPTITPQIQESDDNSTFTAVAAADLDGGVLAAIVAANDETLHVRGYKGSKRYIRVSLTAKGGTTPALPCSAVVVRGKGRIRPGS